MINSEKSFQRLNVFSQCRWHALEVLWPQIKQRVGSAALESSGKSPVELETSSPAAEAFAALLSQ